MKERETMIPNAQSLDQATLPEAREPAVRTGGNL